MEAGDGNTGKLAPHELLILSNIGMLNFAFPQGLCFRAAD